MGHSTVHVLDWLICKAVVASRMDSRTRRFPSGIRCRRSLARIVDASAPYGLHVVQGEVRT